MPKDFSHQDLRGKSFKNQDLTGADFSYTDIRGVSFKGAILKSTNFISAKGGLSKRAVAAYLLIILILSALTGFLMVIGNIWIVVIVEGILKPLKADTDANIMLYTLLFSILYAFVSVYLIRKGTYNLRNISLITAVAVSVVVAITIAGSEAIKTTGAVTLFIALTLAVILAFALALVLAVGLAGVLAGVLAGILAVAGAGVLVLVGVVILFLANAVAAAGAVAVATLVQLILSCYIAYRISKQDSRFDTYRKLGIYISSIFGTNFDTANLTDANFSKASLRYCLFSKETIILRTSFQNAENLKFARLTGTILENKAVRELLVTGNGKNQSYAGMNLKGAYLVGADLQGADFHEADLIGATLENANLRNANLSRIQALGVEFRGADFTGACLESWNIDSTTQLDGTNADYVYLLSNQLERRPASGNFGEGEFAKLFNEVLDTVDFIFRNGIDWQAFMISFDKLREKIRVESEDAEISIQSIANKGDGVFVIKVNVPLDADKAEIHSTLTKEYDMNLRLIEAKYQAQLEGKEELITAYHHEIVHYRQQSTDMLRIIHEQPQIHITAIEKISMIHAGDIQDSIVISGDENKVSG